MTHKNHVAYQCEWGCFGSWLAEQLAATISGHKPATVLGFCNDRHCQWRTLWDTLGPDLLSKSSVHYLVIRENSLRKTVLFFHPGSLRQCLIEHQSFFCNCGYPVGNGLEDCLRVLKCKFNNNCPHEIGVMLGIPLKDVLGFMEGQQATCRGCWLIYGEPEDSFERMRLFDKERQKVASMLRAGMPPESIFAGWPAGQAREAG